jgi:uncharacterized OsmC-like protein
MGQASRPRYAGGMATPSQAVSEYDVTARSTDVFGRVLCGVRDHHFIIDGPVQNGCPGEEVTPVEAFLSAVAACGVELIHAIARDRQVPLRAVGVSIHGTLDRARQARPDVRTLNSVTIDLTLAGVDDAQAAALVEAFKGR